MFYFFVFNAQASLADSLVRISSIQITSKRTEKILFSNHLFSANKIQNSSSNFYVKNYGMGQLSSFSFRGNTPENTQILWNEIPLNSPMNQLMDLNLIHTLQGSKSYFTIENNQYGNAGNISMEPQNFKENELTLTSSIFSYNLYSNDLLWHQKFKKSTLSINHQMIIGKNNYDYIDAFSDKKKMEHNDIKQFNSQVDYKMNLSKWDLQLGIWHTFANKNIPPTRTSTSSEESLKDHNLRAFFSITNQKIALKTSFHSENQDYNNIANSISSSHQVFSVKNLLKIKNIQINKWILHFAQNQNLYILNSTNYNENKTLFELNNFVSIESNFSNKSKWEIGFKQLTQSHNISKPLPYFKFNYNLSKNWVLESQASINQRMPTINELYWNPGGNLLLIPETNFNFSQKIQFQNSKFTTDFSFFYHYIQDGIRWMPTSNSIIWSPQNINKINNFGLNLDFDGEIFNHKSFQINLFQSFLYLHSIWNENYDQIYSPRLKSISQIHIRYKKWFLSSHFNYTSARYTLTDNSQFLPQYVTISSQCGYSWQIKKWAFHAMANIDNITNLSYQEIENRALPLRTFFIQLKINYKPNKN